MTTNCCWQRARWRLADAAHYQFAITLGNQATGFDETEVFQVSGATASPLIRKVRTWAGLLEQVQTVEAQFAFIQQHLENGTLRSAHYDPVRGNPTWAGVSLPDGFRYFRTSAFRAVSDPAALDGPFVLLQHECWQCGVVGDLATFFDVSLWSDGTVLFEGVSRDLPKGKRWLRVAESAVSDVVRLVEDAAFFSMERACTSRLTDDGMIETITHAPGTRTTVCANSNGRSSNSPAPAR